MPAPPTDVSAPSGSRPRELAHVGDLERVSEPVLIRRRIAGEHVVANISVEQIGMLEHDRGDRGPDVRRSRDQARMLLLPEPESPMIGARRVRRAA
ncbi:hypothetical protein GCM10022419_135270 [Nonomuraea rosea]|uniref:UTRA domain-containing protein n=1 Tax=Nonomuraea rosea TaxID=638574 RepID=A0ABP7A892_9ACTN